MEVSVHESDLAAKKNVATVLSFHEEMINGLTSDLDPARLFRPDYIQHNPLMATGAESVVAYFRALSEKLPDKHIVVHRMIVVGNWVWVHFNFLPTAEKTDLGVAGVDIYRFDDDGQIAEHWDTSQPVADPQKALNANGVF